MKKFTEEQLEAINYVGSDILVSASAGSGKTAVLVNRVIKKVLEEHVDIDKLVIVTFTKASAKELKQRIILAIKEKLKETNNETNKKNNEFLKKQLSNISRAYITTIHSFCLDLIKKNFYNLGLDPNIKIIDDNNISIYKQSCIDNIIEDNIDNIYNLLTLFNFKEDELKIYILNIYNYILSHDDYMNYLKSVIEKYNVDVNKDVSEFDFGKYIIDDIYMRLNLLKSNLEYYQDKMSCEEYFDKYIDITEYDINIVNNLINCKYYDDMYNCLNCIENKSLPGGKSKIVNIQLKEDFKSFRNNIYKKEIEYIKSVVYEKSFKVLSDLKVSYNYLIEIYNLVEMLDTEYSKIKRDNCVIDYSDIEHFALKVLNENDLSNNFYEVYIDEYQDSSLIQ
ncbi:MAG: UvrD-helicase domain-containing protein, partial [Clostridia bacterium]